MPTAVSPSKRVFGQTVCKRNLEQDYQAAVNRGLIRDVHTVFAELIDQSSSSGVEDSRFTENKLFKVDSDCNRNRQENKKRHAAREFARHEMLSVLRSGASCDVQKRL